MGAGFGAWIIAGYLLAGAGAPGAPSFAEAWYREVVLGEIPAAAEIYQRIYEDIGPSSRSPTPMDVRRRAALRAGACSEMIGDVLRAREAYSWLIRSSPADDPAARSARIRLAVIQPGPVAPPRSPVPSLPTAGGMSALDRLKLDVARRESTAAALRLETVRLADKIRSEDRVKRRIEKLGIEVPTSPAPPEGAEDQLRGLDPGDREAVLACLADRAYREGLRALRDRDPVRAAIEFRKAKRLGGEVRPDGEGAFRDVAELLRTTETVLRPMEGLAKLAAMRLRETAEDEEARLLRSLRASIAGSGAVSAGDGSAEAALIRTRIELDWAPAAFERSLEMRSLTRDVRERAVEIMVAEAGTSSSGGEAADLLVRARRAALDLIEAASEATDLAWASREAVPSPSGNGTAGPPSLRPGERARRITDELERLLVSGQERYRTDPLDTGPDGWRQEFLDLLVLARWFPEADGDRRFRKLAGEYLGR